VTRQHSQNTPQKSTQAQTNQSSKKSSSPNDRPYSCQVTPTTLPVPPPSPTPPQYFVRQFTVTNFYTRVESEIFSVADERKWCGVWVRARNSRHSLRCHVCVVRMKLPIFALLPLMSLNPSEILRLVLLNNTGSAIIGLLANDKSRYFGQLCPIRQVGFIVETLVLGSSAPGSSPGARLSKASETFRARKAKAYDYRAVLFTYF